MHKRDGLFKLLGLCLLAGVLVAGVLFPVVGAAGVVSNQASQTVDQMSDELADEPPPLVTTVTDAANNPIATLYDQYRIPAASDQISSAMKWALVSTEDRRFYEHRGVDWKGTLRAAVSNQSGGDTQGASTLTQQYVKNYLINVTYRDDKSGQEKAQEQTVARKLKEARIAIQLENKMDKEQILTGYLNVVEFSRQVYGVGAAAQSYFNTDAAHLTVSQSALLAGMVNNPAVLDPWNHPKRATDRRNEVIDRMVDNKKLAPADAAKAKAEPLGVVPGGPAKPPSNCSGAGTENGFFCRYVEDYLEGLGMNERQIYSGGYRIRTTMDQKANHEAKEAAQNQVRRGQKNVANTLSLIRPGKDKHEVAALAANRDYGPDESKGQTEFPLPSGIYNTGGAGSSYKIFTAAAAMDQNVTGIFGNVQSPQSYRSNVFVGGSPKCGRVAIGTYAYCLNNNEGSNYPASMTLQRALATSPNTAFVILAEKAGMGPVTDMASRLGMRKTMASNLGGGEVEPNSDDRTENQSQTSFFGPKEDSPGQGSFTLGVSPLSGLELANVSATILSGGTWCPPTPIGQITDRDGNPVPLNEKPCEQAVPEGLANSLAVGMSKDDQQGGTSAQAAQSAGFTRPVIGKTGTTQENGSATFVGGTPQLAGASMVFRPDGGKGGLCDGGVGSVYTCGSGNMFGGKTPARTFYGAMNKILEGKPVEPLPSPDPQYEH